MANTNHGITGEAERVLGTNSNAASSRPAVGNWKNLF